MQKEDRNVYDLKNGSNSVNSRHSISQLSTERLTLLHSERPKLAFLSAIGLTCQMSTINSMPKSNSLCQRVYKLEKMPKSKKGRNSLKI